MRFRVKKLRTKDMDFWMSRRQYTKMVIFNDHGTKYFGIREDGKVAAAFLFEIETEEDLPRLRDAVNMPIDRNLIRRLADGFSS